MKLNWKAVPIIWLMMSCISCMAWKEYDVSEFQKPFQEKKRWTTPSVTVDNNISSETPIQPDWWKNFQDNHLNQFVHQAILDNLDLKIVSKRIQEAGIAVGENRSGQFPSITVSGTSNHMKQALEEPDYLSSLSPTDPATLQEKIRIRNSQYTNVGLTLNWELDLWGKKKQGYLAALNDYEESKALYRAEYLKLVSDVAMLYFDIRQKDTVQRIHNDLLEIHRKKLKFYENQYVEGLIPQWQVSRQKAEIDQIEKDILEIQRTRKELENRLAVLLGKPAGEFYVPQATSWDLPKIISIPTGLPSDLLTRRPDIIAATYRVKKFFHRYGESFASRFPTISLTGNAGYASSALVNLLKQWSLGITPMVSWSILDNGMTKARIDTNKVQLQIAEYDYQKTVMRAFEEVETALTNIENHSKQKKILDQKFITIKQIYNQTLTKFEMGLLSQLEVFDIIREFFLTDTAIISLHYLLIDDMITLYKALGGGW